MPSRKPTALLELSGAFKKNPQRRRAPEPTAAGPLGDPPARLPKNVRPYWDELVWMIPDGVLTRADRWTVELTARLMLKIAKGRANSADKTMFARFAAALGLTPVDRSRLSIAQKKPKNPFQDFVIEWEGERPS